MGMISTVVTLFHGLVFLLGGRISLGISCGFLTVAVPRCVEEYTPTHLYSTISPFFCAASALGTLISYFLALLLPKDSAPITVLAESGSWRYLFGFPIVI
jgi:MFS family permease